MISVIVPVYNVRKYLDKCVQSIVHQSFRDWELLLIDDGSTDGCGEICDAWAERDSRIQAIHIPNQGVSNARNLGLNMAKGDYIFLTDSDDYLGEETLERLMNAICTTGADMSVCNFAYEFENDELRNSMPAKMLTDYQIVQDEVITGPDLLRLGDHGKYAFMIANWNKLYRRELFDGVRYTLGMRFEDEKIIHHLIYPCRKIALVSYVGYYYVQHSSSFMHSASNMLDYVDAMLDRCSYLLDKDERELALVTEGRVLSNLKRASLKAQKSDIQIRKKQFFEISKRMYRKRWISLATLFKRFAYCSL